MTAILLSLLMAGVYWLTRPRKQISTTEFRERLRKQKLGVR